MGAEAGGRAGEALWRAEERGALLTEVAGLRTEVERLYAAIPAIGQAAHAAHGGRGSFRWCGERCCALAYGVERGQAGAR